MRRNNYCMGKQLSDETKRKLSEGHKARGIRPPSRLGVKMSDETKRKIGAANAIRMKGRKLSEITKKKLSESRTGEKNHFFGKKHSEKSRGKMSSAKLSNPTRYWAGKTRSEDTNKKISLSKKGIPISDEHKKRIGDAIRGEKSCKWIKDRSKLSKKRNNQQDYAYKDWRKKVWSRDGFRCKINNNDCFGRIEAHHILPWRDFYDLRYDMNNGITLCVFHHPRKRKDEVALSGYFQKLLTEHPYPARNI